MSDLPNARPSIVSSTSPGSIPEAFLAAAERAPDRLCVRFEGEDLTYGELRRRAGQWTHAFQRWGLGPGDRAALYLENSPAFLAAYLGILLAGATVVLVNTQYRQVELRHILSDSDARLVLTDPAGRAELERVLADLPNLEQIVTVDGPAPRERATARPREDDEETFLAHSRDRDGSRLKPPDPTGIALIGYTSGTTGRSKGAMLTHRNLAANSVAVTTAWRWTAADHLLLTLPLFHMHGLGVGIHGTFVVGGSVDLRRRFVAAEVYDALLAGQATMFFGVPTMYTRLVAEAQSRVQAGGPLPPAIRLYVSGSAPLSVRTFEDFERLFGQRILERYGMTETAMNLTNPYQGERRPGTVGQPFPGQEARIVDPRTRQPILGEEPGEIQVRGPNVFPGYWQRPDANAEAFDREGWFNTGDLGWRGADGYYTISGRARELIITGGYNVYPREIEEVLVSHPRIADAAVLGLPDPEFGERIVAVVVREPTGGALTPEEIIAFCRDQLASFKRPRQVVFVDSLPRNALGKVQKHLILEQLTAGRRGWVTGI